LLRTAGEKAIVEGFDVGTFEDLQGVVARDAAPGTT
jgi:hypothetical protein